MCSAGYVAVTADDAVYAGGGCDTTGFDVRRSTDGGDTWQEVDTFLVAAGATTRLLGFGMDTSDRALAGGYGVAAGGSIHWLIRRGTDSGSWATADDFQLATDRLANALGLTGRSATYALGFATDASDGVHWVIRRAAPGDSNFSTVDDVGPGAGAVDQRFEAHALSRLSLRVPASPWRSTLPPAAPPERKRPIRRRPDSCQDRGRAEHRRTLSQQLPGRDR